MKKLKKIVCGIIAGLMLTVSFPVMGTGGGCVTVVQAASLSTPKMVSAKASGKKKINIQWKPVKKTAGYRIYRKTNDGKWKLIRTVSGGRTSSYSDTKVTTGQKYTYTVRAYNKTIISAYDKKGVTAVAGIDTLKLNRTSAVLTEGTSCKLKIGGTSLAPVWKSNNPKIASVSKKGWVTANAPGTVLVKGYLGGKRFDCKVTVKKYTLSRSQMAANYEKLKKFISAKGKVDSDSNKYVLDSYQSGNEKVSVGFKYFKTHDLIDFAVGYNDLSEETSVGIDIMANCTRSNNADVLYSMGYKNDSITVQGKFRASSYNGRSDVVFYYEDGTRAEKEIQESGNSMLRAGISTINIYLKDLTGLRMRDLGFTSYK